MLMTEPHAVAQHFENGSHATNGAIEGGDSHAVYEGFGSFHSGNVEEMIAASDTAYQPPTIPAFAEYHRPTRPLDVPFGAPCRREYFRIAPDCTFVNHGAFGSALKAGTSIRAQYEELAETQVLRFMDRTVLPLMVLSIRRLADFLGCSRQELVLMQNATYGLNCAMQLITTGDHVVYFDCEYLSVYNMMAQRSHAVGAVMHELHINALIATDPETLGDDETLCAYIEGKLPPRVDVVVVDHITSSAALMLPVFTHIIPMLRRRGVRDIIVDGAHGPLQYPLAFDALPESSRPTLYIGNLHKWFCAPKSVGFMWAPRAVQPRVPPLIVSHGFNSGFLSSYVWDGTRDYYAALTLPYLVSFWEHELPQDVVRERCAKLLRDAVTLLSDAFGMAPVSRHAPFMSLVRLPLALQRAVAAEHITAKLVQDTLLYHYAVECPVKHIDDVLYLRVSAFIYNDMDDYKRLRDVVLDMTQLVETGKLRVRDGQKRARGDSGCGLGGLPTPAISRRRF